MTISTAEKEQQCERQVVITVDCTVVSLELWCALKEFKARVHLQQLPHCFPEVVYHQIVPRRLLEEREQTFRKIR